MCPTRLEVKISGALLDCLLKTSRQILRVNFKFIMPNSMQRCEKELFSDNFASDSSFDDIFKNDPSSYRDF